MTRIEMETDADAYLPHPEGKRNAKREVVQVKTALFTGQAYEVPEPEAKRLIADGKAVKPNKDGKRARARTGPPGDKAAAEPDETKTPTNTGAETD